MQLKEAYLDRVVGEVEDLASRVALLKGRFAKQKVSVKLEHYWELEYVRTRFAEFKHRVRELEDADDLEVAEDPGGRRNRLEGFDSRCGDSAGGASLNRELSSHSRG